MGAQPGEEHPETRRFGAEVGEGASRQNPVGVETEDVITAGVQLRRAHQLIFGGGGGGTRHSLSFF